METTPSAVGKKFWSLLGLLILIILGGWALFGNKQKASGEPIKFGIATVLSGDFAAAGENMVNAAKLALTEINDDGGINGHPVELIVEDAGTDSKTGLAAVQKLVNADGVKYIIGGTSSNGTLAAAPLVNEQKVLYLTPVTGGSNVDSAGQYVFRVANSDLLAGRDLAHAAVKLGFKKIASIAEVTEYTIDIQKTFEQTLKDTNTPAVMSEQFQPGTTDFRTLAAKIKAANPDAILVASQTGTGGAYLVKQMRELGIMIPVFSDFTFVVNENAKAIVGSFEGTYFADPAYATGDPKVVDFFSDYEKTYGKPSLIPFHAAATYDSVMLLAEGIENAGDDSVKVRDWLLSQIKNHRGLMGTYSFDTDGNSDLGFVIKVVKDGKFTEVK